MGTSASYETMMEPRACGLRSPIVECSVVDHPDERRLLHRPQPSAVRPAQRRCVRECFLPETDADRGGGEDGSGDSGSGGGVGSGGGGSSMSSGTTACVAAASAAVLPGAAAA